jgi:hypothetical protein
MRGYQSKVGRGEGEGFQVENPGCCLKKKCLWIFYLERGRGEESFVITAFTLSAKHLQKSTK